MTTVQEMIADTATATSMKGYAAGGLIAPTYANPPDPANLSLAAEAYTLLSNLRHYDYGAAPSREKLTQLTREALVAAADLLDSDGWVQGIGRTSAGQHCAMGAIDEVACRAEYHPMVHSAAQRALSGFLFSLGYSGNVIDYNDVEGRRAEEVSGAMRKAAENLTDVDPSPFGEVTTP